MKYVILGCFLAMCAGCGGGGGGGSGTAAAPPTAVITVQTVRLTGEVPMASGTPSVLVNGVVATLTGHTWVAEVPYGGGDYTVDYLVDGTLIAREAVDVK